jgi:hypothetical protein
MVVLGDVGLGISFGAVLFFKGYECGILLLEESST